MTASHSLILGGITMVEEGANPPDSTGCVYEVLAEDTSFGNPVTSFVTLLSQFSVGARVGRGETSNREPVLRVRLKAADSNELALGEMALQAECDKANEVNSANTLTWIPPDGAGEPSVFVIVGAQDPEWALDDLDELRRTRIVSLRLQALPYVREVDPVVTPAAPAVTSTTIDDCTSTTGWTAEVAFGSTPTVSVVSGAVRMSFDYSALGQVPRLIRTGTIAATPYLKVRWMSSVSNAFGVRLESPLQPLQLPVLTMDDTGGWRYSWFNGSKGTTSKLYFEPTPYTGDFDFDVEKVEAVSALPFIGSNRQKAMTITPGGSRPTHGSIHVEHASSALGKAVVYTHPSGTGYLPPLSPWRASGDTRSTESGRVSGSKATLTAATNFNVPVSALPTGSVELWAWLHADNTNEFTLHWAVDSWMNDVGLGVGQGGAVKMSLDGWQLVCIAAADLPPIPVGPAGYVRVSLQRDAGDTGTAVSWDEAYLFALDEGRLTIVDCGTGSPSAGGPSKHLWIDAPSIHQPNGGLWRGHSADRSDAFFVSDAIAPSDHDFDPRGMSIFTVTPNATDAATSLEHYRWYTHNVARVA